MPEEKKYAYTNGFAANGHGNGGLPPESPDGEMFLFTSESVGEGHPGKNENVKLSSPPPSVCVRLLVSFCRFFFLSPRARRSEHVFFIIIFLAQRVVFRRGSRSPRIASPISNRVREPRPSPLPKCGGRCVTTVRARTIPLFANKWHFCFPGDEGGKAKGRRPILAGVQNAIPFPRRRYRSRRSSRGK